MRVLVTGATGYIGGRLVPELLARGHHVRCAARTPSKLDARPWRHQVEVAEVDVFDRASLDAGVAGCDAVYFLIHSMDGGDDFAARDRQAAANVRDACAAAGVARIVYLGGLGREDEDLSDHLRSRHEVGAVLADGPVPVTELRAAMIVGSGSASFEMLRHLVEVLPVMTTPRWVDTRVQPIGIRDVLHHLAEVLEVAATAGEVLEVGGPDVMTYRELMRTYAEVAGVGRRIILPVPVLTPGLSSLWIGLVTPLPAGLARPLVESLVNEVVVRDDRAARLLPHEALPFRETVRRALERVEDLELAAGAEPGPEHPRAEDPAWSGGTVLTVARRTRVEDPPDVLFRAMRAACDVEAAASAGTDGTPRVLRRRVRTTLPGTAWLELAVRDSEDGGGSVLEQRHRFHPTGLAGRLAWAATRPVRRAALARTTARLARGRTATTSRPPRVRSRPGR